MSNAINSGHSDGAKVSLAELAKLTGFPIEMIQDEIFKGDSKSEISLEELRLAMLSFIDSTILVRDEEV